MSLLDVQSTTIKGYSFYGGHVFIFSASGVDIYEPSYVAWVKVGFASLSGVTSGAVNDSGIWFGTSTRGVWQCPLGIGDLTSNLQSYYATAGTRYLIQSNAIADVSGNGSTLLVTHDAGAEYFPAPGSPLQYADASGCGGCAVNGTYISYAVASGMHTLALPSADWVVGDATVLTTGSSPALSSNTVNSMAYGSGNNLVIGTGSGVDVYDYTDVTTFGTGNVSYVYPSSLTTQATGYVAYIDSSDDAIIYDIGGTAVLNTQAGTYTATYVDDNAGLSLYDDELERHSFINFLSPADSGRNVIRAWTLYFEIGDALHGYGSVVVKVNGVTVTPTVTAIDSTSDKVTYTPPSASGYRKTVTVEITGTNDDSDAFTETVSFVTETVTNSAAVTTKPPNVVSYKDLSLTEYEDLYSSVGVNWIPEEVSAYYVSESQCEAASQVMIDDKTYHKTILTLRVLDTDVLSNDTQDIKVGDIILFDCASLSLTNQKCEVLASQRVVIDDRIEYNLSVSFYELFAV